MTRKISKSKRQAKTTSTLPNTSTVTPDDRLTENLKEIMKGEFFQPDYWGDDVTVPDVVEEALDKLDGIKSQTKIAEAIAVLDAFVGQFG